MTWSKWLVFVALILIFSIVLLSCSEGSVNLMDSESTTDLQQIENDLSNTKHETLATNSYNVEEKTLTPTTSDYNISKKFTWEDFSDYADEVNLIESYRNYEQYYNTYFYGDDFQHFKKYSNENSEFKYTVYENGGVMIDEYIGKSSILKLPNEIDGYKVIAVGKRVVLTRKTHLLKPIDVTEFYSNDNLLYIADNAFNQCSLLKRAVFSENLRIIGGSAFSMCTRLNSVILPSSLIEIGNTAFYNCEKIETIKIYPGIKRIGYGAFSECYELKSVNLPDNLEIIEYETFARAENLSEINVPSKLKVVGYNAFAGTKIDETIFDGLVIEFQTEKE